eukprot:m.345874 g.345874  ORF g.345874 m.345874 type:complete len:820 (+) comp27499_c0_seq1:32-2491(+)
MRLQNLLCILVACVVIKARRIPSAAPCNDDVCRRDNTKEKYQQGTQYGVSHIEIEGQFALLQSINGTCSDCSQLLVSSIEKSASKAKVRTLRNVLQIAGRQCRGCVEKQDFVSEVLQIDDFPTQLDFHLKSMADGVQQQLSRDRACLAAFEDDLKESSFFWGDVDQGELYFDVSRTDLAQRTVYRSTSSWNVREVLLFDYNNDIPLQKFLTKVQTKTEFKTTSIALKILMELVREALGSSSNGASKESKMALAERGEVIQIGEYIRAKQGVCRHRAFLLKIAMAAIGLHGTLTRGTTTDGGRHGWVMHGNDTVLDAMWYDHPVTRKMHQRAGVASYDTMPVPLGKCGPLWTPPPIPEEDEDDQASTTTSFTWTNISTALVVVVCIFLLIDKLHKEKKIQKLEDDIDKARSDARMEVRKQKREAASQKQVAYESLERIIMSGRVGHNAENINGTFHRIPLLRSNRRPVFICLKSKDSHLAIWWANSSWYVGLLKELGQARGFACNESDAMEPDWATPGHWKFGNSCGFARDPSIVCESVGEMSDTESALNAMRTEIDNYPDFVPKLCTQDYYKHTFAFNHEAGDRKQKFVTGVTIHRLLSSHPNPRVRESVVPFYWASIGACGTCGITWLGKGKPIQWNSLTLPQRREGVMQLWDALSNMHTAGIAHADIKKANIMAHGNKWKYIDFDNSQIVKNEVKPDLSFDMERHITFLAPENKWNALYLSAGPYATDVFLLAVLSCDVLCGFEHRPQHFGKMWNGVGVLQHTAETKQALERDIDEMLGKLPATFQSMSQGLKLGLQLQPRSRAQASVIFRTLTSCF